MVGQQITKNSDPYAPIRKVPLDYNGIKSNAYSVQLEDWAKTGTDINGKPEYGTKWQEKGIVSENYLLIPNHEVKEMAESIASAAPMDWQENKVFFNGKQYMYSMTTNRVTSEVKVGDDISLGFAMWNSYDGSRALTFQMFLNRLVCMNGMVTKKHFSSHRFKHDPTSANWQIDLEQVCDMIHNVEGSIDKYVSSFRNMTRKHSLDSFDLRNIRENHLPKVPTSTWGKIIDKFLCDDSEYTPERKTYNTWDLLNAGTNITWHNKKQTMQDFNMNGYIVEGLCDYSNKANA